MLIQYLKIQQIIEVIFFSFPDIVENQKYLVSTFFLHHHPKYFLIRANSWDQDTRTQRLWDPEALGLWDWGPTVSPTPVLLHSPIHPLYSPPLLHPPPCPFQVYIPPQPVQPAGRASSGHPKVR